jgi:hypothetical protein
VAKSEVRFCTFPRTDQPPAFVAELVGVFRRHEDQISTRRRYKGLTSDGVLSVLRPDLVEIGFAVEAGKQRVQKIERPVFYGENGAATLRYEIDAYHEAWRCGLEVEAGRAWLGNAVYRDLIQAAVMVGVDYLAIAVSNLYKFKSGGRDVTSQDYSHAKELAEAVYGHSRFRLPYGLIVIGY